MARFEEALAVLDDYRVALQHSIAADIESQQSVGMSAFAARGAFAAFSTPLTNVHATGVGIRVRGGQIDSEEFVIKVFVFEKADLGREAPSLTSGEFRSVGIDVEHLPIQLAAARSTARASRGSNEAAVRGKSGATARGQRGATTRAKARGQVRAADKARVPANRQKVRPIVGGLSIAPLNADYVGTLGCFVRRGAVGSEQIFALSNNHVLADVNRLEVGTPIVQPGSETAPATSADIFAALSDFIPVQFPTSRFERVVNRFDAAIAQVTDERLIRRASMFGIPNYSPTLAAPLPGTRVRKSGRTTGVTAGMITAIHVNGVQINYGTQTNPRLATFDDTIEIVGDGGAPFSLPGDSGSAILEEASGRPVALLFAGDGRTTTACDIAGVCRRFQVLPT
jgi:hypothetical protein